MNVWTALAKLYDDLAAKPDSGIAMPGWVKRDIDVCIDLSGTETDFHASCIIYSKENRYTGFFPNRDKPRTTDVWAQFLCDKAQYVLSLTDEKRGRFAVMAENVLSGVFDDDVSLFLFFLKQGADGLSFDEWSGDVRKRYPDIKENSLIAFRVNGRWLHEMDCVKEAWNLYYEQNPDSVPGVSSITGKKSQIASTCIKTGMASLFSFKDDTVGNTWGLGGTESLGIDVDIMRKVVLVLNYLKDVSWENKFRFPAFFMENGDGISCRFGWIENLPDGVPDILQSILFDGSVDDFEQLGIVFRDLHAARLPSVFCLNTHYYILDLDIPKQGRFVVRDFQENTFGDLELNVRRYYDDIALQSGTVWKGTPLSFLNAMSVSKKDERSGKLRLNTKFSEGEKKLYGKIRKELFDSVLSGMNYPNFVFSTILQRIRAEGLPFDFDYGNHIRIAYLKAYLIRNRKEKIMTGLDLTRTDTPYLCGRLFALYEHFERKAVQSDNDGLWKEPPVSKRLHSMSATPVAAFALLPRHVAPYRDRLISNPNTVGTALWLDRQVEDIFAHMDAELPTRFKAEESAMFYIGYYQQRQTLFMKREQKEDKDDD